MCSEKKASTSTPSGAINSHLYNGEVLTQAAGFPAMTRFLPGSAHKPLLVFVPGAHHTARVFYGGHAGANEQDFIAYWVNRKAYNFLALSYPIETTTRSIDQPCPEFTIRDWGRQVATLVKATISEHNLSGEVIVIGWSMGGKICQSVWEAMGSEQVNMRFYLALTATAPTPGLAGDRHELTMTKSGYANRRSELKRWYAQIASNSKALSREIVPEPIYMSQYAGDIPVNLQGYGQQYRNGEFVIDPLGYQQDSKPFDYGDFPLVAALVPNGPGDPRHALIDKATWAMYNANTVYNRWLRGSGIKPNDLPRQDWNHLLSLTRSLDERLTAFIDGNHFFFVGRSGAIKTADAIESLEQAVAAVKAEAGELLGVDVD